MCYSGLMVRKSDYNIGGLGSFPEGTNKNFLFNSDIKNVLLKINRGETEPNFVIFLVWSPLIAGGVEQKLLFRVCCNRIFCVLAFIHGWGTQ